MLRYTAAFALLLAITANARTAPEPKTPPPSVTAAEITAAEPKTPPPSVTAVEVIAPEAKTPPPSVTAAEITAAEPKTPPPSVTAAEVTTTPADAIAARGSDKTIMAPRALADAAPGASSNAPDDDLAVSPLIPRRGLAAAAAA